MGPNIHELLPGLGEIKDMGLLSAITTLPRLQGFSIVYNIYSAKCKLRDKYDGFLTINAKLPFLRILSIYLIAAITGIGGRMQIFLQILIKNRFCVNPLRVRVQQLQQHLYYKKLLLIDGSVIPIDWRYR